MEKEGTLSKSGRISSFRLPCDLESRFHKGRAPVRRGGFLAARSGPPKSERELSETREELERRTLELAEQRGWFEVTLSSIGDAVIATDTKGFVTFLNPVAETMTGWTSAEALGKA